MPFLDLEVPNPAEDYLAALRLSQSVADDVDAAIPGHGAVGELSSARVGPSAPLDWLPDVHRWQLQRLAQLEQNQTSE